MTSIPLSKPVDLDSDSEEASGSYSDTPSAVTIAMRVLERLERAGFGIAAFA